MDDEQATETQVVRVALSALGVDPRLRDRVLDDCRVGDRRLLDSGDQMQVLASDGSRPLWARRGNAEMSAVAPLELKAGEQLRDRLQPERWFALLPLIHFLRRVGRTAAWTPPPLRAAFLIDDPNLHWTSYGYLDFAEVAAAAREHRYHVALGTIPVDTWYAHPPAVSTFRENPAQLSLLMHGNDHLARELARPFDERARYTLLDQALRRISAFEQRSGVPVARVMAAPHGVCSEAMARAMADLDFEGLTISRPYPWLARPPSHWLACPPDSGSTVGMRPAEFVAGGLPVFLRTTLQHAEDDLILRAFLDQPLIVSGHHDDLAEGLAPLARIAAALNRIGDIRWGSLTEIARASFASRLEDGVMRIRPYARVLSITLPEDAGAVAVEAPPSEADHQLLIDGLPASFNEATAVSERRLELTITSLNKAKALPMSVRRPRPWPLLRRAVAEGRDRLKPVLNAG